MSSRKQDKLIVMLIALTRHEHIADKSENSLVRYGQGFLEINKGNSLSCCDYAR